MGNCIFTVDVEEYYHAENIMSSLSEEKRSVLPSRLHVGVDKLLCLLKKNNSTATFFVLGCAAEKNRSLIKKISESGHEIASHGYSHIPLGMFDSSAFEKDLDMSIKILSDTVNKKIIGYRATGFSFYKDMPWFFDVLKKYNIRYDSSIALSLFRPSYRSFLEKRGYFKIANDILEFPVSFLKMGPVKIPLGGGYFRAYPYWLTKLGIRQVTLEGETPFIFYIHPWELDPEQPRFKISPIKSMRHYLNLGDTERRLEKLLSDVRFLSISDFCEKKGL